MRHAEIPVIRAPDLMTTSRAVVALSFALVAACSSSKGSGIVTEPMHAEPDDAGLPDSARDSAAADPPSKDAAPPPAPTPTGECGSETTQTACVTCCSNKHEDGAGVYFVALIDCVCLAENCAKDCATTLCNLDNMKNPDATCNACMAGKNAACAAVAKTACTPDPGCVAFDTCVGESACTAKGN